MRIPYIRIMLLGLLMVCLQALPAQSAIYYISPAGSDTNPGTSMRPWLTFAYAINPGRATCGDTLILRDGMYGDGTRTGKIFVDALVCTQRTPFTIQAENQRKAKLFDNGTGSAVYIVDSAFIVIDGLYARSTDNSDATQGMPFRAVRAKDLTFKNLVGRNPNRFANVHVYSLEVVDRALIEDSEGYVWHRHCVRAHKATEVVVRRVYCNPRGGRIAGGFGLDQGPVGTAGAVFSMYPCRDCIQENTIMDGTTNAGFLNEMNATYWSSILMSNSKVLGSICYKCNYANGVAPNSRYERGLNYTPQNILVRDVAFIEQDSSSPAIRVSDGVNITLDRITAMSTPGQGSTSQHGLLTDDKANMGTDATQNSIAVTNYQATGFAGFGFRITGFDVWSGAGIISHNNGTVASPPFTHANWSNTSTASPGMGNCKVWVPDGAVAKGAGVSGADIGANILYRYNNGVLTTTPLWDQRTGEFPHGAEDADGTNRVPGESLFDIHKRLNVNMEGCRFPENYGNGKSDPKSLAAPVLSVS